MFDDANELKEKQIKGESHLQELSDAVDFITNKFDTHKQEGKEREEIINNLTEIVSRLAHSLCEKCPNTEFSLVRSFPYLD